jgi:hypothetical protein
LISTALLRRCFVLTWFVDADAAQPQRSQGVLQEPTDANLGATSSTIGWNVRVQDSLGAVMVS